MDEWREFIQVFAGLWHRGLHDPVATQTQTLEWLLRGCASADHGQRHSASEVLSLAAEAVRFFRADRAAFPAVTHKTLLPWIGRVANGENRALLSGPPVASAMTQGTTQGVPKRIPITETDLGIRVAAARGLLNYLLRSDQLDIMDGYSLSPNYPSRVGTLEAGDSRIPFGFSSSIYAKHAVASTPARILLTQEEIGSLRRGTDAEDWERQTVNIDRRAHLGTHVAVVS